MSMTSVHNFPTGLSKIKLFFALSRVPHSLMDMMTPAMAALLYLGHFPPVNIILLGILTAFSGYTAVYALNDVVDYRSDKKKAGQGADHNTEGYLDSVMVRHPIAEGLLSYRSGIAWVAAWSMLALIGACSLNMVCVYIFLAAGLLETVYCLLLRVTHLRAVISGMVKTSGPVAAIFAVDHDPSVMFLTLLFAWLFFWEIGGQNIPADWTDIEDDKRFKARTIPVRLGTDKAALVILVSVILAVILNVILFCISPVTLAFIYNILFFAALYFLLLMPAIRLYRTKERNHALLLFNNASFYPCALLLIIGLNMI